MSACALRGDTMNIIEMSEIANRRAKKRNLLVVRLCRICVSSHGTWVRSDLGETTWELTGAGRRAPSHPPLRDAFRHEVAHHPVATLTGPYGPYLVTEELSSDLAD